jgi:hypothetical protein
MIRKVYEVNPLVCDRYFLLEQAEVQLVFGIFRASQFLVKRSRPTGAASDGPWHRFCRDLYFLALVEGENINHDALPATSAENQIIFKLYLKIIKQ